MARAQDLYPFNPADTRKSYIDQCDARQVAFDSIERGFHRSIGVPALEAFGAVDQKGEALARLLLVFNDRHTDDGVLRFTSTLESILVCAHAVSPSEDS